LRRRPKGVGGRRSFKRPRMRRSVRVSVLRKRDSSDPTGAVGSRRTRAPPHPLQLRQPALYAGRTGPDRSRQDCRAGYRPSRAMPWMMGFPADEARHVSDETFRHAGDTIFHSCEVLRKRTSATQWPRSNNGVRSCGRQSSTQFTAKFSGPPCLECRSSQSTDGYPGRRFPGSGRPPATKGYMPCWVRELHRRWGYSSLA
jgi:hypothetical protein